MRDTHLRLLERPPAPEPQRRGRSLAPALPPHGPVPDEIDRQLAALAIQATTDSNALNALYAAYRPRLDHWVYRAARACHRSGADPAIEPEDICQQAFVVFADLILTWNSRGSLSAYIIAFFRWRLSDAVRQMSDPRERRSFGDAASAALADGSHAADEAVALLATLANDLPKRQGLVLLLRIRDGLPWTEVALRVGVDIRTAQRDWREVVRNLRASLDRPMRGQ